MIMVFGRSGQVAASLHKFHDVVTLDRSDVDLLQPEDCLRAIASLKPAAVINAAAYTAVDKAESEESIATTINGAAPACMARACFMLGIPLVHISTDYVFDGSGELPWSPDDPTHPNTAYGRSKLAGERAIISSRSSFAIIRTSWVFSEVGANFVKTMLRLSQERKVIDVVTDQVGGPTPASDIADAAYMVAKQLIEAPAKSGIYHFSGSPNASWYEFATEIFRATRQSTIVNPILTSGYKTNAERPLNSRLNCRDISDVFNISQPSWRNKLGKTLRELEAVS